MNINEVSFDDDSSEPLYVFDNADLNAVLFEDVDLTWGEIARRTALDQRRGLVVLQVAILEDLLDRWILDVAPAGTQTQEKLDRQTIGPRIKLLKEILDHQGLLNQEATQIVDRLTAIVGVRNELAHGVIYCQGVDPVVIPIADFGSDKTFDVEWRLVSRRDRISRRITMAGLREELGEAVAVHQSILLHLYGNE